MIFAYTYVRIARTLFTPTTSPPPPRHLASAIPCHGDTMMTE